MPKNSLHILSLSLFNLCFLFSAKAQVVLSPPPHFSMIIEGHYQNANMYIQSPYTGKDSAFCVFMCLVNDKPIDSINSSAFEIPLMSMGFKEGDSIKIEIWHHVDCKPKVIYNPPQPKKPVYFTDVTVDTAYILHFKTNGEAFKYIYIIEQYRWNKWVKIGEVESKGIYMGAEYSFQVAPHSGVNQVRVKLLWPNNLSVTSIPVEFMSNVKEVKVLNGHVYKNLDFDSETMYEVYDYKGELMLKGTGKSIDCSKLKANVYYVNYDNQGREFIKH